MEKLINFNSPNFDVYLKSLEDIKKKLRLENEEDEKKDEDMEMESKRATKKEEDDEKSKKKKKINNEKETENKRKKKDKKSNKFLQVKQKKKRIMGLFFFKWNLFFTIKVLIILIISISYYLVSSIVNSRNKSNYLDFDQTTDAIEAVYKQTYELYLKLKTEMEIFEERMRVKIDAINDFCKFDNNTNEIKYFNYSYTNKTSKQTVSISCNNSDCNEDNCLSAYAISCVNDVNCNDNLIKSMCNGLQCIDSIENYKMTIPSNEELTTPKLGSLLMPLVSGVDDSSTETEIKLNNLYNNDSCGILVGKDNKQSYQYCSNFWSNILGKGMEQGITQLGLSVASVTDELNSLNDLSDVLNSQGKSDDNEEKKVDNPLTFDNLTRQNNSAFFQFSIFVEYYLFESYLQTYQIFDILRDVKLENIKNSFNIILYIYLVGSIILLFVLLYFVYESKYLLNSFLNFVGIFPVKYLMEDNALYHETLNLEQDVF